LAFDIYHHKLITAFKESNQTEFDISSKSMLTLLDDMNAILSTNQNFLLGKWINSAKALADSEQVFEKLFLSKNIKVFYIKQTLTNRKNDIMRIKREIKSRFGAQRPMSVIICFCGKF